MIRLKSEDDIRRLKVGGHILAEILRELEKYCQENYDKDFFNTLSIDQKCEELLAQHKAEAAFKNYSPAPRIIFPASICVSVNDEIVHGIPGSKKLNEGDIVSLDFGVIYDNLFTDSATSFIIGKAKNDVDEKLLKVTRDALYCGIDKALAGNRIGDIGHAIEEYIYSQSNFGIVRDYCGHGVGFSVHEDPSIPNYGKRNKGELLKNGMVIAIEPMIMEGDEDVFVDDNDWTVKTCDGKKAAHFEHTIAITKDGPVILTE